MNALGYMHECYTKYRASKIDERISPKETMYDEWYFPMGEDAVENIALACLSAKITRVDRVLDLPCGHGRVLRHLVRYFQGAEVHACDLDVDGVAFCSETFGAVALHSIGELSNVAFPCKYDVIWVGSLFTHVARDTTRRWMRYLANFLSPHGVVVATIHGRWCENVNKVYPYIGPERWVKVLEGYRASGYGYCDYVQEESHSFIESGYGISLARAHVTIKDVEEIPGTRIYMYRERACGDHQDVVAFGKPPYDEKWPGM